jgi:hypothetical protein
MRILIVFVQSVYLGTRRICDQFGKVLGGVVAAALFNSSF